MFYYPPKFPEVIGVYEKLAKKYYKDPDGLAKLAESHYKDMSAAVGKIKKEYDKGDKNDIDFLIEIDQRLAKAYCFRFWIVNYLFADGPIHEYYVDKIKYYSRRLVDVEGTEVEDYEKKILEIQRDLMQGDYADLYLQNALRGVKLMKVFKKYAELKNVLNQVRPFIEEGRTEKNPALNKILDRVYEIADIQKGAIGKELSTQLEIPLDQSKWRKTRSPFYSAIVHAIEFEKENLELEKRQREIKKKIDGYFKLARAKMSLQEAKELEISYRMARELAKSKDVMGNVDGVILPFWLGMLDHIADLLRKMGRPVRGTLGPGGMFYRLAWYLPDNLKIKVYTPDRVPFDINKV